MEELEFFGRLHEKREGMVYLSVRAISASVNLNYDGWPSEELKKSYKTFIDDPIFVDHHSEDKKRARGIILDAEYVDSKDDKVVWLLLEIDAEAFPNLSGEIVTGGIDSVSMGAMVDRSICSICGNVSRTGQDFCSHIPWMKGETIDGKLCYEICRDINFYEISLVFEPADVTAVAKNVVASIGTNSGGYSYTPQTRKVDISQYGQPKTINIVDAFPYSYSNEESRNLDSIFEIDPYARIDSEMIDPNYEMSELF